MRVMTQAHVRSVILEECYVEGLSHVNVFVAYHDPDTWEVKYCSSRLNAAVSGGVVSIETQQFILRYNMYRKQAHIQ